MSALNGPKPLTISLYPNLYRPLLRERSARLHVRTTGLYQQGDRVTVLEVSAESERPTGRSVETTVCWVLKKGTGRAGDELKLIAEPTAEAVQP